MIRKWKTCCKAEQIMQDQVRIKSELRGEGHLLSTPLGARVRALLQAQIGTRKTSYCNNKLNKGL